MYRRLLQRDKQFRSEFGDLHNAAICHRACSKNIAAVKRDSQYGLIRICNGIFVDDCRTLTQNAPSNAAPGVVGFIRESEEPTANKERDIQKGR
jgi:hypothetical protein